MLILTWAAFLKNPVVYVADVKFVPDAVMLKVPPERMEIFENIACPLIDTLDGAAGFITVPEQVPTQVRFKLMLVLFAKVSGVVELEFSTIETIGERLEVLTVGYIKITAVGKLMRRVAFVILTV